MKPAPRLLLSLVAGGFLFSGCASPPQAPPPAPAVSTAEVIGEIAPRPENAYYYFLAAQGERRAGRLDRAIVLLREAIAAEPDSAFLRRELATLHLQNKEEGQALAVLEELRLRHPEDAAGLILQAGILQSQKKTAEALELYEAVLRLDPKQEQVHAAAANLHLERGDLDGAERVLQRMVELFPESYTGHFLLGRLHLARGKPAAAAAAFRRSAQVDPESTEPLFELLKIAREADRGGEAARVVREILERDRDNGRALLEAALLHRAAGETAEAQAILRRLGERSRGEFEIILHLIQGWVDPRRFEESLFLLEGMLQGAPEQPDLHHLRGFCLFGMKRHGEALEAFRRVTPASRFHQDASVHIAFILQEQGKGEEARAHLAGLVRSQPQNADLKYYLATLHEEARQFEEALELLQQAVAQDEKNARFHFRLGVVHDKMKNKEAAIEAMKRAIELDPKDAAALNYLGYTYADLGIHLEEAERLILEALKHKPDDGYITDSLGWVYYKKGEYEKALHTLKKASELVKDDPVILEHVGDAYLKLGDRPNALRYYQKSMEIRQKAPEKEADPDKQKEKEDLQMKIRRLREGRL
ncbi:MAG: tetratricopeptide repeat protein [Desulfobacterales bacterium]